MQFFALIGFIFVSFIPSVGSLVTDSKTEWYTSLAKPWFNPPDWVFGLVWPFLFFTLGLVAFRAWEVGGRVRFVYTQIFLLNTALLTGWSYVFFGAQSLYGGLVLLMTIDFIAILKVYILARHGLTFWKWLIPYSVWIFYASILNLALIILN